MSASDSPFCAHRRLRTSCPECKPVVEKKAPAPRAAPKTSMRTEDGEAPRSTPKAMLPRKTRPRRVGDRNEAEQAEAWWVKKK